VTGLAPPILGEGVTSKANPLRVFGLFTFHSSLKLGAWHGGECVTGLASPILGGGRYKQIPIRSASLGLFHLKPSLKLGLGMVVGE
jgi:hypothetical protein